MAMRLMMVSRKICRVVEQARRLIAAQSTVILFLPIMFMRAAGDYYRTRCGHFDSTHSVSHKSEKEASTFHVTRSYIKTME